MSTYVGLYVQRLTTGQIFSVQVRDSAGHNYTLDPAEYNRKVVAPPISELPNIDDYYSKNAVGATIKLRHDEWKRFVGKHITVQVGGEVVKGVLVGLDESVMATAVLTFVSPWKLETPSGFYYFSPEAEEVKVVEVQA